MSTGCGSRPATAPAAAAGGMPAAANRAPARQRTWPTRAWAYSALAEVTVTISRLAVVAAAGLKPSR
ncbi:hypothetical protein GCM10012286_19140 [Streptomyces lasiicapitis]|uniref:Uncharacterized protein n=1 Tax=Streptomyces lasiicapitis TaxID=1923961 RepID=A0ABQ2LPM6_9ACTN|nr:hypothetical protein GCM10012286_19140 [Streptomyces lasiicapitis]